MAAKDPHSYTDTEQGVITNADFAFDFSRKRPCGKVTYELASRKGDVFDLDIRDIFVKGVYSGDTILDWSLDKHDPIMGSRLRIELPEKYASVTIIYAISQNASGLQWLDPEHTEGGKYPYIFTQCQPHHARSIVPIQDSAMVRFRYSASIMVPSSLSAVMAAAPGVKKKGTDVLPVSTDTYTFEMPQPIPSYLLAFAIGNIAHKDISPRVRIYAEPEIIEKAAWEFAETDEMLSVAEKLFGPYEWDRFDLIVMPRAFPYGGMENPRLTFLTPTLLAGDRSLVSVVTHEAGHSWLGNLVTNATMDDFWLNEGWTMWAQRRIIEAQEGEESAVFDAAIGRIDLERTFERFGLDSSYTRLKTDLKGVDPDEVFSKVPYEKGFLFITLLERTAGRKRFDMFVRKYIEIFSFTSVSTEQFLEFLEKELSGVAEKVNAEEWVYGTGLPENAPQFHSERMEQLQALASEWDNGARPDPSDAKTWRPAEWIYYFNNLPDSFSYEDCTWLDDTFQFSQSDNAEILCEWLLKVIQSKYTPAFPKMRMFLRSMGRMRLLRPLYTALSKEENTLSLGRDIFERYKHTYHPTAQTAMYAVLYKDVEKQT